MAKGWAEGDAIRHWNRLIRKLVSTFRIVRLLEFVPH